NNPHTLTIARKKDAFYFDLPIKSVCYINLIINRHKQQQAGENQTLIRLYIMEPDDDVSLRLVKKGNDSTRLIFGMDKEINSYRAYRNYRFHFTGTGSAKYRCRYSIDSTLSNVPELA